MSQVYCWECENSYARDEVLDIPVFDKGFTIQWCLNCVMKQLQWTDYRLIPAPQKYKKFRIKSVEDDSKEYQKMLDELVLCFEAQFRKIKRIDDVWGELQHLAQIEYYNEERIISNGTK